MLVMIAGNSIVVAYSSIAYFKRRVRRAKAIREHRDKMRKIAPI